jgi:hypothetical protein
MFHRKSKKPRSDHKFSFRRLGDAIQRVFDGSREVPNDVPETPPEAPEPLPEVLEVWFAGAHTDVGGSAVEDGVPSLADISLKWMVEQVEGSNCGIRFKNAAPDTADIDTPTPVLVGPAQDLGSEVYPQTPPDVVHTEKEKDVEPEALTTLHDDMASNPLWWFLEFLPTRVLWQNEKGKWKSRWM